MNRIPQENICLHIDKMSAKIRETRIPIELKRLMNSQSNHGITCTLKPNSDNFTQLVAIMTGPSGTPYAEGEFKLDVTIGDRYPFQPPTIKFQTPPPFHPNIDACGNICLDLLRMPPNGTYNPAITLESILVSIRLLLTAPNSDDPLNCEAAEMFRTNPQLFARTVQNQMKNYCNTNIKDNFNVSMDVDVDVDS